MGMFPKFRIKPKLNKKQKEVLGKELGLDKFLTQEQMQSFYNGTMEKERRREILNRLSPKMKLAVGQKILAERGKSNAKQK